MIHEILIENFELKDRVMVRNITVLYTIRPQFGKYRRLRDMQRSPRRRLWLPLIRVY